MCVTSSLALTLSLITVWNCYIQCLFGEWDLSHSQGPEIGEIYSSVWLCFAIAMCVWEHLSGRHNSPTKYTHCSPRTLTCLASGHREKNICSISSLPPAVNLSAAMCTVWLWRIPCTRFYILRPNIIYCSINWFWVLQYVLLTREGFSLNIQHTNTDNTLSIKTNTHSLAHLTLSSMSDVLVTSGRCVLFMNTHFTFVLLLYQYVHSQTAHCCSRMPLKSN